MEISTQFSVMFREKNTSPKDLIEKLINHGHLDAREESIMGRWFNFHVLPWLKHITKENQNAKEGETPPPVWEYVYPDVYVSVDGDQFTVYCACGPEWPSKFHSTSFLYNVKETKQCKDDTWVHSPSIMNFRLVGDVRTDEPIFVVKARDPQASRTIADWAVQRYASQHYFDNDVFRLKCVGKARGAIRVLEEMRQWKNNNPLVGEADIVGRPNEYTLAHRMSHLLTDAAAVNVRVTVENKVDPLTGHGQSVVDYRRKRHAASGTYPNPDIKGYVLQVTQKIPRGWNEPTQDIQEIDFGFFKNENLIAMSAIPEERFIPEKLAEIDAQQV